MRLIRNEFYRSYRRVYVRKSAIIQKLRSCVFVSHGEKFIIKRRKYMYIIYNHCVSRNPLTRLAVLQTLCDANSILYVCMCQCAKIASKAFWMEDRSTVCIVCIPLFVRFVFRLDRVSPFCWMPSMWKRRTWYNPKKQRIKRENKSVVFSVHPVSLLSILIR